MSHQWLERLMADIGARFDRDADREQLVTPGGTETLDGTEEVGT